MAFGRVAAYRRRNVYRRRVVRRAATRGYRRRAPTRRLRRPVRRYVRRRSRTVTFTGKNAHRAQMKTVLHGPDVPITTPAGGHIIFNMFPDWHTMQMWPTGSGIMGINLYGKNWDAVKLDKIVLNIRLNSPGHSSTFAAGESKHQAVWHTFDLDADGRRFNVQADFDLSPGVKKRILKNPRSNTRVVMYPKWYQQTAYNSGSTLAENSAQATINPWWDLGIFNQTDPAHLPQCSSVAQQICIDTWDGVQWVYNYDMYVSYKGLRQGSSYAPSYTKEPMKLGSSDETRQKFEMIDMNDDML